MPKESSIDWNVQIHLEIKTEVEEFLIQIDASEIHLNAEKELLLIILLLIIKLIFKLRSANSKGTSYQQRSFLF